MCWNRVQAQQQIRGTSSETIFAHLASGSILAPRGTIWERSCSRMNTLLVGRIHYQQVEFVLASYQLPSLLLLPTDRSPGQPLWGEYCLQEVQTFLAHIYIVPNTKIWQQICRQDQVMSLFQLNLCLKMSVRTEPVQVGYNFKTCSSIMGVSIYAGLDANLEKLRSD